MSSFRRKASAKQSPAQAGAKVSSSSPSTNLISTGVPSLDDILGGGLPLSCSLLITAPDYHSSYGELVQKYFIAQGLKSGHDLCVVAEDAEHLVRDVMWTPRNAQPLGRTQDEEAAQDDQESQQIKIAWRYEQMKSFQTTVLSASSDSSDNFCHTFDLSSRIPASEVEEAIRSKRLSFISSESLSGLVPTTSHILDRIKSILQSGLGTSDSRSPLRICVPSLGSPWWGDVSTQLILNFLHSLRSLLRCHPDACACISLAPYLSRSRWGGPGWLQKLGWVSDAALSLSAFSADPSLAATFPNHHGLLHIYALPAPHTLCAPSDKFSTLRGLSATAGPSGGTENNITFKSMRKRFVFETLHLDIEGGVSERRTAAPPLTHKEVVFGDQAPKSGSPAVEVEIAGDKEIRDQEVKPKKPKKQVAFRADRPELYDF